MYQIELTVSIDPRAHFLGVDGKMRNKEIREYIESLFYDMDSITLEEIKVREDD